MSSKSRKHSSAPARTPQQGATPAGQEGKIRAEVTDAEHAEPTAKDFIEAEDILKVPRGRSRGTYAFLIFLLIFLAATFIVLDYLPYLGGGRGRDAGEGIAWRMPDGSRRQLDASRWQRERALFGITLETLQGGRRQVSDEVLAQFIVLDSLAEAAGVRVTDAELVEQLRPIVRAYGGTAQYQRSFGARRGITVTQFEETFQRLLRIDRFRQYVAVIASQPGAGGIEALWHRNRRETAFDWAMVPVSRFVDAARAEQPDDDVLANWFEARPDHLRARHEAPARTRAEIVGVRLDGDSPDLGALLAAYPPTEEVDAAARAKSYYDQYAYARFRTPPGTDGPLYLPFEEVSERAAVEAAAYDAMRAWRRDLGSRIDAGEEVDLAAEAQRLGLAYVAPDAPRTQVQWREAGGLAGVYVAGELVRLPVGRLSSDVVVGEQALSVARVVEQVPPSVPPLSEIREAVLEEWVSARAKELATAAASEFRASLFADADQRVVDEAAFLAAAQAAGFEVGRRDWLDSGADLAADPDASNPAHVTLRARAFSLTLGEGEISDPLTSPDESTVVVARSLGSREVPLDRMTISDFQSLADQARQSIEFQWAIGEDPFSLQALVRDFDLRVPKVERTSIADEEGEDQP